MIAANAYCVPETVLDWHSQFFLFLKYAKSLPTVCAATLGPVGTSSEAATSFLLSSIVKKKNSKYELFSSYEESFENLLTGVANLIVVANAYGGIDKFYMSPRVSLLFSFVFETPNYGVAKLPTYELPIHRPLKIATHHAPTSLIPWFLTDFKIKYEIVLVKSTSEAAIIAQRGEVDLCVTNSFAAQKYGVEFISPTRSIRMLWSVFGQQEYLLSLSDKE